MRFPRFARYLLIAGAAALASLLVVAPERTVVAFDLTSMGPTSGTVSYTTTAGSAPTTAGFSIVPDGRTRTYTLSPTKRDRIVRVVIAVQGPGTVALRNARVSRSSSAPQSAGEPLPYAAGASQGLVAGIGPDGQPALVASAPAIRAVFDVPPAARANDVLARRLAFLLLGLVVGLLLDRAASVLAALRRRSPVEGSSTAKRLADRVRACLRDPMTIEFDRRAMALVAGMLVLAAIGVAGKLHQSSLAKWDEYLPSRSQSSVVLLGEPRGIRSDEWLVHTPWMLSQMANGQPIANPNLGAGHSTLLTSVPTRHVAGKLQPEFWGFDLLGRERGYSWLWMYKLFGLFTAMFLLLQVLTRNDVAVSALGAASIVLASFTQWWFSTNLPELLTGFALSLVGLAYVAQSASRTGCVVGAVMLLLGAMTFVFQVYPPFQVVVGYVALAIILGLAADPSRRARFRVHAGTRVACLVVTAIVLGGVFYAFWVDAASTIDVMVNTAYPGKRMTVGGNKAWWALFDGYFEAWRIGESDLPLPPTNASEASNFALFFPLVAIALLWRARAARPDGVIAALAAFCVLLAAWMVVPIGEAVAVPLAKWSLLSFVPPHRGLLGVGVGSCLLVAVWIAWLKRQPAAVRLPYWTIVAFALSVLAVGLHLAHIDNTYFTAGRIALGVVVSALAALAIARGSVAAYAGMVVLLALPAASVNPLSRGLAPLLDKPAMRAVVAESRASGRGVLWIVPGSFVLPQAMKANGIPTFGGATYLPDAARMRVLDPDGGQSEVWNRYAHIQVESVPGIERPEFHMIDAPGLYGLRVDVCSDAVRRLGVTHVAYPSPPPAADRRCLVQVPATPVDGLWLYRLGPAPVAPRPRIPSNG